MKRTGEHFVVALLSIFGVATANRLEWSDYYAQYPDMDTSALKACWMLDGALNPVDVNSPSKGSKCDVTLDAVVADDAHARQLCASRFPFPITAWKTNDVESTVSCVFQINLFCLPDWFQINGKCYKVLRTKMTYAEASRTCSGQSKPEQRPRLAEFYSDALGVWLADLDISAAWLDVPDMQKYYANGGGDGDDVGGSSITGPAGVFVWHGAFGYETGKGTIVMEATEKRLHALCEYTPPMTMAEMYYRAGKYNQIYPITITSTGASLATSSYMTIDQKSSTEYSTADGIKEACKRIGNILNVDSFPLVALEQEWLDIKHALTNHRFHLTSAFKNDGCSRKTYYDYDYKGMGVEVYRTAAADEKGYCDAHSFSFHKDHRVPTMASMRAPALCTLHTYGFEYAPCPAGWVQFDRPGKTRFCHFIENHEVLDPYEARKKCRSMGAALSGFESGEEFNAVLAHIKPSAKHPKDSETHYRLGGRSPCNNNCADPLWRASWDEGVSRNTRFLNEYGGEKEMWSTGGAEHLSFRQDEDRFHLHGGRHYYYNYYVCGRYSDLVTKKLEIQNVKKNG